MASQRYAPPHQRSGLEQLSFLKRDASAGTTEAWLLVLMHGVGSNERDLFGLASHMPGKFHVVSLRAPNTMGPGSYAWFQFSVSQTGERLINAPQETESRRVLLEFVTALSKQLSVPPERVVLGGFSQGGIMALSLLLTQPGLMKGAMAMHSRLLPEVLPLLAAPAELAGKQLWVSAGSRDQVLPLAQSHAIRERVQTLPLTLTYTEFASAHEISAEELGLAVKWLEKISG